MDLLSAAIFALFFIAFVSVTWFVTVVLAVAISQQRQGSQQ